MDNLIVGFENDDRYPRSVKEGAEEFYDEEITPKLVELHALAAQKGIPIFTLAMVSNLGKIACTSAVKEAQRLPIPMLLALTINHLGHRNAMDMIRAAAMASKDPTILESLLRSVLQSWGIDGTGMSMGQMGALINRKLDTQRDQDVSDLLEGVLGEDDTPADVN